MSHHPLHKDLKKVVSPSLNYSLPSSSHASSKQIRSWNPSNGTVFSPEGNGSILLTVPGIANCHLNGQATFLSAKFAASGSSVYYSGCLSSWIKRLVIRGSNGEVIDDITEYASVHRILQDVRTTVDTQNNQLSIQQGYGTVAEKKAYCAGKRFNLLLLSSFLRSGNLLPLGQMGGFTIEIFLAPSSDVLIVDSGTGSYQISEVQLRAELLTFNPAIDNAVNAAFRASKISIHSPSFTFHSLTSQAILENWSVPNLSRSLRQIIITMRLQSTLHNWSKDALERTAGNINSFGLQIGGRIWEPLTNFSDMYMALCRSFGWDVSGTLKMSNYSTEFSGDGTSFLISIDLTGDDSGQFISGDHSQASVECRVQHSSAPSEPIIYDCFLVTDRLVWITPTGINVTS
jgi:hypothetical protein